MKRVILAIVIFAVSGTAYSCSYKCVSVPPPGGYSYDQTEGHRSAQDTEK